MYSIYGNLCVLPIINKNNKGHMCKIGKSKIPRHINNVLNNIMQKLIDILLITSSVWEIEAIIIKICLIFFYIDHSSINLQNDLFFKYYIFYLSKNIL